MRVLVSGTNGFIGRALVSTLWAEGVEVHAIVRGDPKPGDALLDVADRDLDLSQLPNKSLEGIDAVVHLAGDPITPTRWSPRKRERLRSSRIVSTDVIARAIARSANPPATFLCASAIGIYGNSGEDVIDEKAVTGTGFLAELCRSWESATVAAREVGTRVVNLRTGIVLGRGGGALAPQIPLFRLGLGARLGSGEQWTSWISLDDEIGAIVHLLTRSTHRGPCNLTSPNPVRNKEFADRLASSLGRTVHLHVPRVALRLACGSEVTSEVLLANQRVVPSVLESDGYAFRDDQLDSALEKAVAR